MSQGECVLKYLIWSNTYRAWWRSGEIGYTDDVYQAGVYDSAQTFDILAKAALGWSVPEEPSDVAVELSTGLPFKVEFTTCEGQIPYTLRQRAKEKEEGEGPPFNEEEYAELAVRYEQTGGRIPSAGERNADQSAAPGSEDMTLEARIAQFIRESCPDDSVCLRDEDECFRLHPIHGGGSINGVIDLVYADVDGAARLLAGLFRELVVEDGSVAKNIVRDA